MKKFLIPIAAVAGLSFLTLTGTAEAGNPWNNGPRAGSAWNGGSRGYNNNFNHGYNNSNFRPNYNNHYDNCSPNRAPAGPVIMPYPNYAPAYVQPYPVYSSPNFGLVTPSFGLFLR